MIPEELLSIEELVKQINSKIINENGKINPAFHRKSKENLKKEGLDIIIYSVNHYTNYISNISLGNRISLILSKIITYPICECKQQITKLKIRNGKCLGFNDYCSQSCANKYTNYKKTKEFYKKVAQKIVKTRKKNKSYIPTPQFREYNKLEENRERNKKIIKEKYGVENAGVLGAYSSKEATEYIKNYIIENGIPESQCYFKGGGINNKEYFLNFFSKDLNKYLYFSYDLVVVDKDKNIVQVLEYNGPWHYSKNDLINREKELATPYPKSKTKQETYDFDILKLNTIRKKCENILIYWRKNKKLEVYNGVYI